MCDSISKNTYSFLVINDDLQTVTYAFILNVKSIYHRRYLHVNINPIKQLNTYVDFNFF